MAFSLRSHKRAAGLDISDHSLELVELTQVGERPSLSSMYRRLLPSGIVVNGRAEKKQTLVKMIGEAFESAKPKPISPQDVTVSLPDKNVFMHSFTLTLPQSDKDHTQFIEKRVDTEARGNIPFDDPVYSYVLRDGAKPKEKNILIVGSGSDIVKEWADVYSAAHIPLSYFDIEPLAIARGLYLPSSQKQYCIIDIGYDVTSFAAYTQGGLVYTYIFKYAGKHMTKAIADALSISPDEAEEMKVSIGLSDPHDPIFGILYSSMEKIIKKILSTLKFIEQKYGYQVNDLHLVGGGANLKKIVDFVADNSGKNVYLGKPRIVTKSKSLLYVEAVGLAMRGLYKFYEKRDPVIPVTQITKDTHGEGKSFLKKELFKKL